MKTIKKFEPFYLIGLCVICIIFFAFTRDYQVKDSTAEVNSIDAIYIFTDSTPIKDFIVLGDVSGSGFVTGAMDYKDLRKKILKKMRDQYPQANGAIFSFSGSGGKCEAIKFKD